MSPPSHKNLLTSAKSPNHFLEDRTIDEDDSLDDLLDIISHMANANNNAPQPTPSGPLIHPLQEPVLKHLPFLHDIPMTTPAIPNPFTIFL